MFVPHAMRHRLYSRGRDSQKKLMRQSCNDVKVIEIFAHLGLKETGYFFIYLEALGYFLDT